MIADLLLLADALLVLAMGAILAVFPAGTIAALGLPAGQPAFYRRLLGAALIGVGLAEMMNALPTGLSGTGLGGAIAVNVSLGAILCLQLLKPGGGLSRPGRRLLWLVAATLLGLGAAGAMVV